MEQSSPVTCCIIPAYRAANTIVSVVASALKYVDAVIVVDDSCPEQTGRIAQEAFADNPAVRVIIRRKNGGVGAAMKTGFECAFSLGARILVKIDADGQMDPAFIPKMIELFDDDPTLVCVKGNRFLDGRVLSLMPKTRLFGNAALSLMAKVASGYWNSIDPTNGFLALNAPVLKALPWRSFADSYFFELSVLCELGLRRLPVVELEMPTIYTSAPSSLSIRKVLVDFPPRLLRAATRRLAAQYLVFDVNLGSLYALIGVAFLAFGISFGAYEWIEGLMTHTPRATGTIMLAALPTLMGFQLLLNALMYDVQASRGTRHELMVNAFQRRPVPPRDELESKSKDDARI